MTICGAIHDRKLVSFHYKGHQRVVVPGAYGLHHITRNQLLRAYQVRGTRNQGETPGWGLFRIDYVEDFRVLDEAINNIPPGYVRGDSMMAPVYCQL